MDNVKYLSIITLRAACGRHSVPVGRACFRTESSNGEALYGVCDFRAQKAGFVGKINPLSLSHGRKKHDSKK